MKKKMSFRTAYSGDIERIARELGRTLTEIHEVALKVAFGYPLFPWEKKTAHALREQKKR